MKKRDLFIVVFAVAFGLLYQFFKDGDVKFFEGCSVKKHNLRDKGYPNRSKLKDVVLKGVSAISIRNPAGSISLNTAEGEETEIKIFSIIYSKRKKIAEKIAKNISALIEKKESTAHITISNGENFPYSRVRININIAVPSEVNLDIKNRYGDIIINVPSNKTVINEKYGDIKILYPVNNLELSCRYSKVKVNDIIEGCNISSSKYSYFEISGSGSLNIKTSYSKLFINNYDTKKEISIKGLTSKFSFSKIEASDLNIKNSNGRIYLENIKVDSSKIISNNCKINIDKMISGDTIIKNSYAGVKINELKGDSINILIKNLDMNFYIGKSINTVNISAKYSDIDLFLKKDISPFFDINATYGEIKNNTSLAFLTSKEKHKIRLSGGGKAPKIVIFSNYSDIKLKNN